MLKIRLPITNDIVTNLMDSQLAFINFKHPNFIQAYSKLVSPNETAAREVNKTDASEVNKKAVFKFGSSQTNGVSAVNSDWVSQFNDNSDGSDDSEECQNVKGLIKSYFDDVRDQMKDLVPKITVKFLIFFVKENLQDELVDKLNKVEILDDLLFEDKYVPILRKEADDMLKALGQAERIIGEIDHHRV